MKLLPKTESFFFKDCVNRNLMAVNPGQPSASVDLFDALAEEKHETQNGTKYLQKMKTFAQRGRVCAIEH